MKVYKKSSMISGGEYLFAYVPRGAEFFYKNILKKPILHAPD